MWSDLLKRKFIDGLPITQDDFEPIFQGITNAADWPTSFFSEELVQAYPNAKVILTTRDNPDTWHKSVLNTLWRYQQPKNRPKGLLQYFWYYCLPAGAHDDKYEIIFAKTPFGNFPERGKQWYLDHNQMIRDIVPPERLLEFNAKQGWKPLLEFLGKDMPEVDYPHVNDGVSFRTNVDGCWARWRTRKMSTIMNWLSMCLLGFSGLFGILHFLQDPAWTGHLKASGTLSGKLLQ